MYQETKDGIDYLKKIMKNHQLKGKKSYNYIKSPIKQMLEKKKNKF